MKKVLHVKITQAIRFAVRSQEGSATSNIESCSVQNQALAKAALVSVRSSHLGM